MKPYKTSQYRAEQNYIRLQRDVVMFMAGAVVNAVIIRLLFIFGIIG